MALILVIDDDPLYNEVLVAILTKAGYSVLSAFNGDEGVKLFKDNPVDLVVTDIIMPEKEGIETIMEMKTAKKDIGIIAISGGGRGSAADYLEIAASMGADRAMDKPLDRTEFLTGVKELLS